MDLRQSSMILKTRNQGGRTI
eukprot:COSAG04_NODE_23418_length_339_cov_0.508333_1_plen_20_part_10